MTDYVYCSNYLFKEFKARAEKEKKSAALALEATTFTQMTSPLQDVRITSDSVTFDIYYHKGEKKVTIDILKGYPSCVIPQKEHVAIFHMPPGFTGEDEMRVPFAAHRAWHIQHWNHINSVNILSLAGQWKERWEYQKFGLILSSIWAIIRTLSINPYKVASKLTKVGKKCNIHPTAVVEASILGNNVSIGALAVVKGSILADGVRVQDCAHVEGSSIGKNVLVGKNCVVYGCVLYPESIATQRLMQGCILGYQAATTGGGYLMDLNYEQEIKVKHKGKYESIGSHYCGVCLGHRVRLGTGIWINHGREIPNDCSIIRDPTDVLSKLPEDLIPGEYYYIKEGRLEPVKGKGGD